MSERACVRACVSACVRACVRAVPARLLLSSERWSVLSVSLSVEPTGGRCLPAGCKLSCRIFSGYPPLR